MFKQIIIARKDLNMSPGKLAAQVSHASMAFLTRMIQERSHPSVLSDSYNALLLLDKKLYEQWICGIFTKIVLGAKNKTQLLKAKTMAEEFGMKEGTDFFLIMDNCLTELEPEEDGRTLTCIGFKPMDNEIIDKIGKKYHVYV